MHKRFLILPVVAAATLAGCMTVPTGPNVSALPGSQKPWEVFRADDVDCRNYAYSAIGGPAGEQAAANAAVGSAVAGTLIGAAAGLAFGGTGPAAAVGAGSGLLVGSAVGSGAYGANYYTAQHRYDNAYMQCMYAKGNQVPMRSPSVRSGGGPYYSGPAYPPPVRY
jgi:hypothetical protein